MKDIKVIHQKDYKLISQKILKVSRFQKTIILQ